MDSLKAVKTIFAMLILFSLVGNAYARPERLVTPPTGKPGEWIAVLAEEPASQAVPGLTQSVIAGYDVQLVEVLPYALKGFVFRSTSETATRMLRDPRILFIEQNAGITVHGPEPSGTVSTLGPSGDNQLWHLDRVDEPTWNGSVGNVSDQTYNMCTDGDSVYAYVVDMGVRYDHSEFGPNHSSRVPVRIDFSNNRTNLGSSTYYSTDTTNGCSGVASGYHGTSVAATLAGNTVGASRAKIVSLKIMDCPSGSLVYTETLWFLRAMDWIANPLQNPYIAEKGVVNFSGFIPRWDPQFSSASQAARGVVNATRMPFFTSADNYSVDACGFAPNDQAYTPTQLSGRFFVVGGIQKPAAGQDYKWQHFFSANGNPRYGRDSGSNAGSCVSGFAPATEIYTALSSGGDSDPSNDTYHVPPPGTSWASPIVAGLGSALS